MTKKTTKRENFTTIKAILEEQGREDLVKVMEHELELLARKNGTGRKPTATQIENEVIKEKILEIMNPNQYYTATEIMKNTQPYVEKELANQKVTALLRGLIEVGKIVRVTDKRKSLFILA